jgi:4-azaleucine resistance transporter AzlC
VSTQFTRRGFAAGATRMLPLLPGVVALALLYGYLAVERGLSVAEAGLTSALVFAGASQFLALQLWTDPLPVGALFATVITVNVRHVLMGATMRPWLGGLPAGKAYASLYFMTDEAWGLSVAEMSRGGRDAAFLPGAGFCLYVFWVGGSIVGGAFGGAVPDPERYGITFVFTAFFLALLSGFWRSRADLVPWGIAVATALVLEKVLPGTWYILLGALAGSLTGAVLRVRRS